MPHWSFWWCGIALAAVALSHWLLLGRQLAVSGRFTAIVNRLRHGPEDRSIETVPRAELIAALQDATALEFGTAEPEPSAPVSEAPTAKGPLVRKRDSLLDHAAFLVALAMGGMLAVWTGGADPGRALAALERQFEGHSWLIPVSLALGGVLVGFGTRMAGGCTSGHGLCGVSRLQKGSLLATLMFFASGVGTALLLEALL